MSEVEEEKSLLEEKHIKAEEEITTLKEDYNNFGKEMEEQTSTPIKGININPLERRRKVRTSLHMFNMRVAKKRTPFEKKKFDKSKLVKDGEKGGKRQSSGGTSEYPGRRKKKKARESLDLSVSSSGQLQDFSPHLIATNTGPAQARKQQLKDFLPQPALSEESDDDVNESMTDLPFSVDGDSTKSPEEKKDKKIASVNAQLEKRKVTLEKEIKMLKLSFSNEKRTVEEQRLHILKVEKRNERLTEKNRKVEEEIRILKETLGKREKTVKDQTFNLSKTKLKLKKLREKLLVQEREKAELQMFVKQQLMGNIKEGMMARFQKDITDLPQCDYVSVIAPSDDSGFHSSYSAIQTSESMEFENYEEHQNTELKVAATVTSRGANMHIPDTGVELDIPTGAIGHKAVIEMTILPFGKLHAPVSDFSRNSSVAVELHPNRMVFKTPVRLTLPHCLQLKKDYKKTKNSVRVFMSHHEKGQPQWEEVSNAIYSLDERHCTIYLKNFCWVKYEINNKIVVAKRLKVFTAGKHLEEDDHLAEMEVGYHMDLPGRKENLGSGRWIVSQSKPFIFLKEGEIPLQILLAKTVPMHWKYITSKENPKTISFKSIANEKETSCPFAFEKDEPTDKRPYCLFKVIQGTEEIELTYRF